MIRHIHIVFFNWKIIVILYLINHSVTEMGIKKKQNIFTNFKPITYMLGKTLDLDKIKRFLPISDRPKDILKSKIIEHHLTVINNILIGYKIV